MADPRWTKERIVSVLAERDARLRGETATDQHYRWAKQVVMAMEALIELKIEEARIEPTRAQKIADYNRLERELGDETFNSDSHADADDGHNGPR